MEVRMKRRGLAVCTAVLGLSIAAWAQGVDATLKGRVSDASGAAVPNVKVAVTNTGTNVVTAAPADSAGLYTAPFLKPGVYSVTVEAPGFKKFLREGINLSVGSTVELDVALEV